MRAKQVVNKMLEGGMESWDYSPEDLARYDELKAHQMEISGAEDKATGRNTRMLDYTTGEYTPEWQGNHTEYEKLRNRYNGMPPKQRLNQLR